MPDSASSDEELMLAAAKGDLDSFESLVKRHQAWVWRVAYRFTGNKDESEDIAQETFLRLLRASGRYRATAKFTTYLYRIVSRLCLDYEKKRRPLYLQIISHFRDSKDNAVEMISKKESAEAVRAALDSLKPNQRLAVTLRYYEDFSYKEIAAAMNISLKAAERLLYRGRKRLEDILTCEKDYLH